MSDSVRPQRWQPTRLPRPWDSPGKNTGVGCHFLLQCMKVKSKSEVAQLCPTPSDPMDCSLPGSSVQGIFQARVLESYRLSLTFFPKKNDIIKKHQGVFTWQSRRPTFNFHFILLNKYACTPMADSCQRMAKPIQYYKVITLQLK